MSAAKSRAKAEGGIRTEPWKERVKHYFMLFVATGGLTGYFPVAPGTAGSLVGVGLAWVFRDSPLFFNIALCVFLGGLGVWTSQWAGKYFKKADSPRIVIDEIVGVLITMLGIPITGYWLVVGFIVFRFFDIVKFPPANLADRRMKNGWGVMLDDVFAAIYGNVLLHLMVKSSI